MLRKLLGGCLQSPSSSDAEAAREGWRPPPPALQALPPPFPSLHPPSCSASQPPPSPSKLPLAHGSLSPASIRAPQLADALDWMDGQPASPAPALGLVGAAAAAGTAAAGTAAAAAAAPGALPSTSTSPVTTPRSTAEQLRRAFAAGQRRRRVTPDQEQRERQRTAAEQADHKRTVQALEKRLGRMLSLDREAEQQQQQQREARHEERQPTAAAAPARAAPPPPRPRGISLAPTFQNGSGTAVAAQLVPLHSRRRTQTGCLSDAAALDASLVAAAAAAPAVQAATVTSAPASSAGSIAGSATSQLPWAPARGEASDEGRSRGSRAACGRGLWAPPSSDAGTTERAGASCCSVEAQPTVSRGQGGSSSGRSIYEEPALELAAGATTPAGAGYTAGGSGKGCKPSLTQQRHGRSPANREEVPVGATPSFAAFISGVQQGAGPHGDGSSSSVSSTAAWRPATQPCVFGPAASESRDAEQAGVAAGQSPEVQEEGPGEEEASPSSLPACDSQAALLGAGQGDCEEATTSSAAAPGSLIAAVHGSGGGGARGRGQPPRQLLSQLRQVLHGRLPPRAPASKPPQQQRQRQTPRQAGRRQQQQPQQGVGVQATAEDVQPRPKRNVRLQLAGGGHSADENVYAVWRP